MSSIAPDSDSWIESSFRHEALFYAGRDGFLDGVMPFLEEGIAAGEPTLVVVSAAKIALLKSQLNGTADGVRFADMDEVGANPARMIPAWRDFVAGNAIHGGRLRGIGEPIHAERAPAALAECHRHESLLNVAFADSPGFWLLCPYDTEALDPAVVEEAQRTHPFSMCDGVRRENAGYGGLEVAAAPFNDPLPEPPESPEALEFGYHDLDVVRKFVFSRAAGAGLSVARMHDFVLAINEIATNSIRHGGGRGRLRAWSEAGTLICEVRDRGRIAEPLAGRERPDTGQVGGHGLWMANQLCDLVQVRAFPDGGVIRLHMQVR